MQLSDYLKALSKHDKRSPEDFAARCGTTVGQLRNIACGHRRARESLAINIERESRGAVLCETLRPDVDWAYLRNTAAKSDAA